MGLDGAIIERRVGYVFAKEANQAVRQAS